MLTTATPIELSGEKYFKINSYKACKQMYGYKCGKLYSLLGNSLAKHMQDITYQMKKNGTVIKPAYKFHVLDVEKRFIDKNEKKAELIFKFSDSYKNFANTYKEKESPHNTQKDGKPPTIWWRIFYPHYRLQLSFAPAKATYKYLCLKKIHELKKCNISLETLSDRIDYDIWKRRGVDNFLNKLKVDLLKIGIILNWNKKTTYSINLEFENILKLNLPEKDMNLLCKEIQEDYNICENDIE